MFPYPTLPTTTPRHSKRRNKPIPMGAIFYALFQPNNYDNDDY
jgi:hypothetical protein